MGAKLFERLTEAVDRRSVLQKMAQAAGAIALALIGADVARAVVTVKCCTLCIPPNTCTYSGCTCEWCWPCCFDSGPGHDNRLYSCDECYSSSGAWCNNRTSPGCSIVGTGGGTCPSAIKCSRARLLPVAPCAEEEPGCKPTGYCY